MGADVLALDKRNTALHNVVYRASVLRMIEAGADIQVQNSMRMTPISQVTIAVEVHYCTELIMDMRQ